MCLRLIEIPLIAKAVEFSYTDAPKYTLRFKKEISSEGITNEDCLDFYSSNLE